MKKENRNVIIVKKHAPYPYAPNTPVTMTNTIIMTVDSKRPTASEANSICEYFKDRRRNTHAQKSVVACPITAALYGHGSKQ